MCMKITKQIQIFPSFTGFRLMWFFVKLNRITKTKLFCVIPSKRLSLSSLAHLIVLQFEVKSWFSSLLRCCSNFCHIWDFFTTKLLWIVNAIHLLYYGTCCIISSITMLIERIKTRTTENVSRPSFYNFPSLSWFYWILFKENQGPNDMKAKNNIINKL